MNPAIPAAVLALLLLAAAIVVVLYAIKLADPPDRRGQWALLVAGLLCAGCARDRIDVRTPVDFAGAMTDVELYAQAKRTGDKDMRANLRDAWHTLGATEAKLALVLGSGPDGKVERETAQAVVDALLENLKAASAKLEQIADAQASAEIHYSNARAMMQATLGLLQAMAEADEVDAESQARLVNSIRETGAHVRRALSAAATGGVR